MALGRLLVCCISFAAFACPVFATDNTSIDVTDAPPVAANPVTIDPENTNALPPISPQPGTLGTLPKSMELPMFSEPTDEPLDEATDKPGAAPDPAPPAQADDARPAPNTIVLQGLNKVTGHISKLEAPVGTVMRFGNLEIIGRRCWQSPPDEQPENAGLLEIWELKPGESHERIFLGWIFSSSPGLSGLEHPVYDVTMLECLYVGGSDADAKPAAPAEAPTKPAKR